MAGWVGPQIDLKALGLKAKACIFSFVVRFSSVVAFPSDRNLYSKRQEKSEREKLRNKEIERPEYHPN